MIRIVADDNIPSLAHFLGETGHLVTVPGREISRRDLRDAGILIVRSVTTVDAELLDGTDVRFVGTATAGVDHVDIEYLRQRGIAFRSAPGANADAVVEYVLAAMFAVARDGGAPIRERTLGVVGCGNVGGRLARRARAAGMRVLVNDPPLAETVGDFAPGFEKRELSSLVAESDVVSLHVPLERSGDHPTYHLLNRDTMSALRPGAWVVNTSRGAVLNEPALLDHLATPGSGPAILDVWVGEPTPEPRVLAAARIATPHIAGYSHDAKLNATRAIADAVHSFLGRDTVPPPALHDAVRLTAPPTSLAEDAWIHALIRQMYDIERESARFRSAMREDGRPEQTFARLRSEHLSRRSFRRFAVDRRDVPEPFRRAVAALGVQVNGSEDQS